jgi:hypothetical protein
LPIDELTDAQPTRLIARSAIGTILLRMKILFVLLIRPGIAPLAAPFNARTESCFGKALDSR